MNFNFEKKNIVCKFNSCFITTSNNNLKVLKFSPKISKEHFLLHNDFVTHSNIIKYFKDPTKILKNQNFKENLKAFVSISSKGKVKFKKVIDGENKFILGLLALKKHYWKKLLSDDVNGFLFLSKFLKFNAYEKYKMYDKQFEILRLKNNILTILNSNDKEKIKNLIKKHKDLSIPILNHIDFCTSNTFPDPLFKLDKEYYRMLDFILFDQQFQIDRIEIESSFYKEVELFNNYLQGIEKDFDKKWFKTLNERGVRDFIGDKKDLDN